jgi:predicted peroxiredoxin
MRLGIAAVVVLMLSAYVGCSQSNSGRPKAEVATTGPATTNPAITPQTVAAAATSESIDVEIEGTWQGHMVIDGTAAAQSLKPEQVAALKSMYMSMTFYEDGTLLLAGETAGRKYESQNRWDFVDMEGNKLVLKSIDSNGNEKNIEMYFNHSNSFDMPLTTEALAGAMRFEKVLR